MKHKVDWPSFCAAVAIIALVRRCVGALVLAQREQPRIIRAGNTILCTGGAGQLYRETTNPEIATGDGLAMASRAGVGQRVAEDGLEDPEAFLEWFEPAFLGDVNAGTR